MVGWRVEEISCGLTWMSWLIWFRWHALPYVELQDSVFLKYAWPTFQSDSSFKPVPCVWALSHTLSLALSLLWHSSLFEFDPISRFFCCSSSAGFVAAQSDEAFLAHFFTAGFHTILHTWPHLHTGVAEPAPCSDWIRESRTSASA